MDVVLLVIATGVSFYIQSRCIPTTINDRTNGAHHNSNAITFLSSSLSYCRISLTLSLLLFALSLIEVGPASWMLLLDNSTHNVVPSSIGSRYWNPSSNHRYTTQLRQNHFVERNEQEFPIPVMNVDDNEEEDITDFKTTYDADANSTLNDGRLPLTTAYFLVLWLMSILVFVIIPSSIGMYLISLPCAQSNSTTMMSTSSSPSSGNQIRNNSTNKKSNIESGQNNKTLNDTKKRSYWKVASNHRTLASVCMLCHFLVKFFLEKPISFLFRFIRSFFRWKRTSGPVLVMTESDVVRQPSSKIMMLCSILLKHTYGRRRYLVGSVAGVLAAIAVSDSLCSMVMDRTNFKTPSVSLLGTAVSWLTSIGIILSAVMNGFGSVSLPYSCLVGLYLDPVQPEEVEQAEDERDKLIASLESRTREANTISIHDVSNISSSPHTKRSNSIASPGKISTSRSFVELGDDIKHRQATLVTEIEFLENLLQDVNDDLVDMKQSQIISVIARTTWGRIRSYVGILFSIILVARLSSSAFILWNEFMKNKNTLHFRHDNGTATDKTIHSDIVTKGIMFMMGHNLAPYAEYDIVSQFLNVIVAAFLSVTQVNTLFRTIGAVNYRISNLYRKHCSFQCSRRRHDNPTPNLFDRVNATHTSPWGNTPTGPLLTYLHIVAALLSCYSVACVVLTKIMLDFKYRGALSYTLASPISKVNFSSTYGHGEEHLYHIRLDTVNLLYVTSAIISAATLLVAFGIQKQNTKRYLSTMKVPNTSSTLLSTKAHGIGRTSSNSAFMGGTDKFPTKSIKQNVSSTFEPRISLEHIDMLDP